MNEPLASITLIAAVLAFLWAGPPAAYACASPGAAAARVPDGVTVMSSEAIAFGFVLAAIAGIRVYRARDYKFGLEAPARAAGDGGGADPWTVRNAVTLHEVTPVGEGGGNALFIGTWLPGDGDHFKLFDHREELMDEYHMPQSERAQLRPGTSRDVLGLVAAQAHPGFQQDKALSNPNSSRMDIEHHTAATYGGVLSQKFWNMWGQGAAAKIPGKEAPAPSVDWLQRLVAAVGLIGAWRCWPCGAGGRRGDWCNSSSLTAIAVVTPAPPRRAVDPLPARLRPGRLHWRLPAGSCLCLGADRARRGSSECAAGSPSR